MVSLPTCRASTKSTSSIAIASLHLGQPALQHLQTTLVVAPAQREDASPVSARLRSAPTPTGIAEGAAHGEVVIRQADKIKTQRPGTSASWSLTRSRVRTRTPLGGSTTKGRASGRRRGLI